MEYDIEKILYTFEDDYNPSSTVPGPRNMYNQGQLVQPSGDGSRPGYSGLPDFITKSGSKTNPYRVKVKKSRLNEPFSGMYPTLKKAKEMDLKPLAKIIDFHDAAIEPNRFTIAPSKAIKELALKTDSNLEDIDLFEINEAFSMVPIVNTNILSLDDKKVNINGGAVSLGHPLGCSGARILTTLIHNLHRLKKKKGIAAICNGGGGASSVQIKI